MLWLLQIGEEPSFIQRNIYFDGDENIFQNMHACLHFSLFTFANGWMRAYISKWDFAPRFQCMTCIFVNGKSSLLFQIKFIHFFFIADEFAFEFPSLCFWFVFCSRTSSSVKTETNHNIFRICLKNRSSFVVRLFVQLRSESRLIRWIWSYYDTMEQFCTLCTIKRYSFSWLLLRCVSSWHFHKRTETEITIQKSFGHGFY